MLAMELVRKSVVFIGYELASGEKRFAGSAFLVRLEECPDPRIAPLFLVTARHVIDAIKGKGLAEVLVRFNTPSGNSVWEAFDVAGWKMHPDEAHLDVAFLHLDHQMPDIDHRTVPSGLFVSPQEMASLNVQAGDEVFLVGLFNRHIGTRRNIPIVRVGNLACVEEERVATGVGMMDALLIEARSLGGLSGSPVFIDVARLPRRVATEKEDLSRGPLFIGLVHGHYDEAQPDADGASVNAGIAIVVPTHSIQRAMDPYLLQQAKAAKEVTLPGRYFAPVLRRRRLADL